MLRLMSMMSADTGLMHQLIQLQESKSLHQKQRQRERERWADKVANVDVFQCDIGDN